MKAKNKLLVLCATSAFSAVAVAFALQACVAKTPPGHTGYCQLDDFVEAGACNDCLTASCCDDYGVCVASNGSGPATDEYDCLIDAGTLAEVRSSFCALSATPASSAFITCMKNSCADQCGVAAATCAPDPTVPELLPNVEGCDPCVAYSCCTSLNACFGSRPCALAFQCVLQCKGDASSPLDLQTVFDDPLLPGFLKCADQAFCGDGGTQCLLENMPANGDCIGKCVQKYDQEQEGGLTACHSVELFECATTNCTDKCKTK